MIFAALYQGWWRSLYVLFGNVSCSLFVIVDI